MRDFRIVFDKIKNLWFVKVFSGVLVMIFIEVFNEKNLQTLLTLSLLIGLDFLLGVLSALKDKRFTAGGFFKIFWKLLVYTILLSAGFLVSYLQPSLKIVSDMLILFLAASEFLSILKNAGKLGVKIPDWLLKKLDFEKEPTEIPNRPI